MTDKRKGVLAVSKWEFFLSTKVHPKKTKKFFVFFGWTLMEQSFFFFFFERGGGGGLSKLD